MCNHIKTNGEKCKNKSKSEFCHMHKTIQISKREGILQSIVKLQQQQIAKLEEELKIFKIVNKKNGELHEDLVNKYNETDKDLKEACEIIKLTKNEVKNLNKTLEKKSIMIKELTSKINILEVDANNYKIIKEFEKEKQELIKQGINIYDYKDEKFHEKRWRRNELSHAIY